MTRNRVQAGGDGVEACLLLEVELAGMTLGCAATHSGPCGAEAYYTKDDDDASALLRTDPGM